MKTIAAAKFKEQCLAILDNVDPEGIVITKRGKPVAKLVPMRESDGHLIGLMEGEIEILGDIMSTGIRWEAEDC